MERISKVRYAPDGLYFMRVLPHGRIFLKAVLASSDYYYELWSEDQRQEYLTAVNRSRSGIS